ncbi:hypothetical protein EN804_03605 [Mesorhizobium sp. M8A.F.Ca.ET.161.01.1.1]|nr:hypothetical protein EN848_06570 [bacterium M00.F.Ca.ET.205.01.1.1]TGT92429.1 hypothetical protein EN804_03605 [Mesorhizobium sp. M8A.F.Ca.ET.161.01.1.1]TGU54123.1 hypothetical protein EN795_10990 [bacterium M00.F.Ca.ET.152.01.1.1]TGV37625.1 hypothetical protein EN829_011015 [Mesorhizobium sp. M00.F.Ca.ET.186.01.1.1]TGV45455.1 hypothetical protein EN785_03600 [Mesorhizobium sp. M8A.F.Ca.ET.142.01.1.1]TGZ39477.1 hypothetical protein EN805_29000 [bacterium M00.F.Ca.ET.162.01.1.1]
METDQLVSVRADAARLHFHPRGTVRCVGAPLFKNQSARYLGCLLDVDPEVAEWSCLPLVLHRPGYSHVPDFLVVREEGTSIADAVPESGRLEPWIEDAAAEAGYRYEVQSTILAGHRLANSMDLLRYARWHCPLGDRIRVLAALDEHGSLTVAECLTAFHETVPIAGLSSLVLRRFVEIDLDEARIGPETAVRRIRG